MTFLDVRLTHAQRGHALRKLIFFFQADGERAHGSMVAAAGDDGKTIA